MAHRGIIFAVCVAATPLSAQEGEPLSAIDWLSQSVATAPELGDAPSRIDDEPPTSDNAASPLVTVTPLDAPSPDGVGLLSPATTGLPTDLWANSAEDVLVTLVRAETMPTLPAMRDFFTVLMLAEADAPLGASPAGALFLARVDRLLDMGALQQAQALLEEAGADTPALFRRWFDVALLTGTEAPACDVMQDRPSVAPTAPARIFCLARSGDWPTAVLTLNTNRVLGDITQEEEALLSRFLDPDLFEGKPKLPNPARKSPLVFRMHEAIGESLTTPSLPLAFAHADLRDTTGWKAQLEAAERLTRHGALSANKLQALYTSRTPSASGGIWDRVAAFQRFDTAITARDPDAVADALPQVWDAMRNIKAEVPFAQLYATALSRLPLTDKAQELAFRIGFLSAEYESFARDAEATYPFLSGVARGRPDPARAPNDMARAVALAFSDATAPKNLTALAQADQLGEALLRAIATFEAGSAGDPRAVTDALAFFRSVGLEDLARRAALQLLILERET